MVTALLMGLAGSLHCAGMCSPLAMAVTARKPFMMHKVIYNTGRVLTYGTMGAVAAAFGSLFSLTNYQALISLTVGGIFLLMGVGAISGINIPYFSKAVALFTARLKSMFGYWLQRNGVAAVFVMGMLNGVLPCGLTYVVLTYCFLLPSAADGFLFMFVFGMGTWPVMIGVTWLLTLGWKRLTLNYRKITTWVFIAMGCWLVARAVIIKTPDSQLLYGTTASGEVMCP